MIKNNKEGDIMGSPLTWYKRALLNLSNDIINLINKPYMNRFTYESSTEELECFIRDCMLDTVKIDKNDFYFYSGISYIETLREAEETGCDAFNACICGLEDFTEFIKIKSL